MSEKYNANMVIKQMADDISDFVYKVVKKLSYTKGYRGTVTEVGDGYAKVKIKGDVHTVKTDYPLVVGEAVVVLSLQNQLNDYVILPNYRQIKRMVEGCRV